MQKPGAAVKGRARFRVRAYSRKSASWVRKYWASWRVTGLEGRYVPLQATIESFKTILSGEVDDLPENAFFNVGDIDDVKAKARTMKAGE